MMSKMWIIGGDSSLRNLPCFELKIVAITTYYKWVNSGDYGEDMGEVGDFFVVLYIFLMFKREWGG